MKKLLLLCSLLVICAAILQAQDSTEVSNKKKRDPNSLVWKTFDGTKIVSLQSVETVKKKELGFRISHRFGEFSSGGINLFGLDGPASIHLGLNYGITDDLMVGVGRSAFGKLIDGWAKYRLLRQTKDNKMPISLSVYSKANITHARDDAAASNGFDRYANFSHRLSYITQVIIARKFGERIGIQIAPTYIHWNLTEGDGFKNDIFALSFAGRVKVTKRFGITLEGSYIPHSYLPDSEKANYYPSMGVGFEIETGGHIFQFHVINSFAINDVQTIPYTQRNWLDGDIRLGFNISRSWWL